MVKSLREPILNRIARELDITGDRLGKPDESVEVQAVDALEIIENLHSLAHIYWTLCGIRFVYRHRVCEAADAVDVSGRPAATVARRQRRRDPLCDYAVPTQTRGYRRRCAHCRLGQSRSQLERAVGENRHTLIAFRMATH